MTIKDYSVSLLGGSGANDYTKFMQTDALLSLQQNPQDMRHRDELLFQIVHQSTELWLKLSCNELTEAAKLIESNQINKATALLHRSAFAIELITNQLTMLKFMTPWDFQGVRPALGNGSGFESPGWKSIQKIGNKLSIIFDKLIKNNSIDLIDIYKSKRDSFMFNLAEALIEWDEQIALWRTRHYKVAVRTIGHNTVGTKGMPIDKLTKLISYQFFPKLWEVRTQLTNSGSSY
ncbi:MAG: hypothetical protein JKX98_08720 [Alcanivoracaceae bacterium]|nr:hypothetical protein [Alcanivoracaceae bacterium]